MKTVKMARRIWCVLIVVLSMASPGFSQMPTGSIIGSVFDPSGAIMPGVELTLRDTQTGATRTAKTTAEGSYEFLQLRPSTYAVTAAANGFQRLVEHNIVVNVGAVVHLDLKLVVGDLTQTVEVTGEPPLIEPDKTSISRSVDTKAVMNLPMEGRQILNLALTAPGTVPGAPGTQVTAFSVSGMRTQSNNYTLDGISNNDPQVNGPLDAFRITDAIQEFTVQTSIASTEVGRNSGAQVSLITKSGTNAYHGTAFYYGRNDALDANNFFLNRAGQRRNPLRRHQFGGTVGGFIVRDKTFWFFSYEGFRQKTQQPITARVPTIAERNSVTDPVSQRLLLFWPLANTPLVRGANWTGTTASLNNNNTYLWKVDQKLTTNHRLSARYVWFSGNTNSLQNIRFPFHGNITNLPGQHSMLIQETWATSRLVSELRLGYTRNRTFFQPEDVSVNPAKIFTDATGAPLPGYINTGADALDGGVPRIGITGIAGLGAGTNMPQGRATNTYEVIENLSLIGPWGWSRHTLRFGGEYRHEITNRFLNGNYRGDISFASFNNCTDTTFPVGDPRRAPSCFAQGRPQRGSLRTGVGGTFRTWSRTPVYLYAQDSFKARANLTFNFGLRWEYPGQSTEKLDRGSNFVPGVGQLVLNSNQRIDVDPRKLGRAALILTPTVVGLPSTGQFHSDYTAFAPFLGIAYSPRILPRLFGEGRTVIRTGFRLSYDDIFANIPVNMGLNFPPVLTTTLPTTPTSTTPTYSWASVLNQNRSLFAADPSVPGGQRGILTFNAWDTNPASAYGMNYALEVERQIGRDYAAEFSYVGSQGRHLGVFVGPNQPTVTVVNPTRRGDQAPNRRVFPFNQYAGISLGTFSSNSNYQGMVATLRKRPSHGVSFTASYTLGKALDDNSSFFGSDRDDGSYADSRNRQLDHARSGFDVRHRVVVSYIYELPFGPGRALGGGMHGALGQLLGGWDVSGIVTYRSGFPFTVFAGTDFDYSGLNRRADRPSWAPGVNQLTIDYSDPSNVFSCHSTTPPAPASVTCPVFVPPQPGTVGNVARNNFGGPTSTNVDFGVRKNFRISEGRRVQLRTEFFNFFNHTNFDLPQSNIQFNVVDGVTRVTSSLVGTITTAQPPRLVQLGLRLEW